MSGIAPVYAAWLACIAVYDPITPATFDQILRIDDDVIGIKTVTVDGIDILTVTPAGSETLPMWKDNLEVAPIRHPMWGDMHSGFFAPAQAIYAAVKPLAAGKKLCLAGHSRGAALAVDLAALFLQDGIRVDQLFAFECPKPGCQPFADYLAAEIKSGMLPEPISTTNGPDPVPDVPALLWPPYVKPLPTTDLDHAPGDFLANAVPTNWHAGKVVYAGAVARWGATAAAV